MSLHELPIALAPGDGDDGIWTGSIVSDDEGRTRLFYTSVQQPDIGIGRIRVAVPEDQKWIGWRKEGVVTNAPDGLDLVGYRDPFVIRSADGWDMFVGAGLRDGTAVALRYSSPDLERWSYQGIALERSTRETEPEWMGALWECPQFFEIDGRQVMISSVWDDDVLHYAGYSVGSLDGGVFAAENWGRLSYGPSYYAPSFFRDAEGRPCVIFWMRGVEDKEAGWASAHSLPYLLSLDGDRLTASVHPDLDQYLAPGDAMASGLSASFVWSPTAGDDLVVGSAGDEVLRVGVAGAALVVTRDDKTWELPFSGGDVRLIVDGPVAELVGREGLLGVPIMPVGTSLTLIQSPSGLSATPLSRPTPSGA